MHLTIVSHITLFMASQIYASPLVDHHIQTLSNIEPLFKRANPAPVSCGPPADQRAWPLQSIEDAFNALVANDRLTNTNKPRAGDRYYPRPNGLTKDPDVVTALNAVPECRTGQPNQKYFEFPVTDPVFAGDAPGSQARIVFLRLPQT